MAQNRLRLRVLPALLPRQVELQSDGTNVQWRYVGDASWTDLFPIPADGAPGTPGAQGDPGEGVPTGGTTGQVLAKASNADFDTEWVDQTGGSGAVDSVNGQTGAVVLDAGDLAVTPTGNIASTDVQSALAELDAEKQPLDSDLTAIAALTTTSFGRGLLTKTAAEDVRTSLATAPYVATRTALKALDTTKDAVAVLTEAGREGVFLFRSGDYSALVTADTLEGIYVKATAIASSSGAWVRVFASALRPEWFGTVGASDDSAVLNACFALAYTIYADVQLTRQYTTTSPLSIKAQTIRGTGIASAGIIGNHSGHVFDMTDVSPAGLYLSNFLIAGNGTTDTNGTSTGLYISASTEITSHLRLENLQFYRHGKGIDGQSTYAIFDSVLDQVDFLACATWGEGLGGSQVQHFGCSYRNCGWGVEVYSPSSGSIGGGGFFGCTWIGNTFDFVFDALTARPIEIDDCWFEQTKTITFGRTASGDHFLHGLKVSNTLFQPSGTAVGNGVTDLPALKGLLSFDNVVVYSTPYASATLPGKTEYGTETDLQFRRTACATTDGSTVTPLLDVVVPFSMQQIPSALTHSLYGGL